MRRLGRAVRTVVLSGAAALAVLAGAPLAPAAPSSALEAQARTRALVVVGLGGTAEYRERFHTEARTLRDALVEQHGLDAADVVYLGERVEIDPEVIGDRSTRENVLAVLARFAEASGPADRVLVVLIGHGSSGAGGDAFNLPGPDVGPADLAEALAAFGETPVAFVHTGSGSGAYLEPLSGPERIVITATRTGRELNATRFGEHFVAALSGEGADIDRDGRISLLEAYTYARDEVARHYESENQIQTEHAMLDDDGDGSGTHEAGPDAADGRLASTFAFGGRVQTDVPATDDPELARLYRERAEIQNRIEELRALSGSLDEDVYLARMEDLLVELALKNREIEAAGGGS
jgi:hypothetical protein